MWDDLSPIWLRPQYDDWKMYKADELLQVVGHTPVDKITRKGNVISCDVFSTYRDGSSIGKREFLWLDTKSWEYKGIEYYGVAVRLHKIRFGEVFGKNEKFIY